MNSHVPTQRRGTLLLTLLASMGSAAVLERSARGVEPEVINWRQDYGSALEEARSANRLLWIQFTGPWCPNCTRMERDSFPNPRIVEHSRQSFVPLKLQSDIHEQLAMNFNLSGLPATVLVAPSREVIAVHQGYLGPAEFEEFLTQALARHPEMIASRRVTPAATGSVRPPGTADGAQKKETELALSGYCPVSLIKGHKLIRGQDEYTVHHEGRIYRFADRLMIDLFRKEPQRYTPLNQGSCPVTQVDKGISRPGDPRWGVLYREHLFLCATEADRRIFLKSPERYSMVDVAEQGFCAHCIEESGLLVRGDARHEISRDGRRYWFPDLAHRDAFLTTRR